MSTTAVIFGGAPVILDQQPPVPKADWYLCADAGVRLAEAMGITPHRMIGDFDSLGQVPEGEYVTVYSPEKDDTDLMLAAKFAMAQGCDTLWFYGALGGRLDHTVANLQMLRFLAAHRVQGILVDENHWVTLQWDGTVRYPKRTYPYFSLFSMTETCEDVTLRGTAYPLEHGRLCGTFPLGVSNQILEEEAVVTVGSGELLVIYARDAKPCGLL